jgi:hypothetical protein
MIVCLGNGLSNEQFLDDTLRETTLVVAVQSIRREVTGIRILRMNYKACTVTVSGSSETMNRLEQFVRLYSLGTCEEDSPTRPVFGPDE